MNMKKRKILMISAAVIFVLLIVAVVVGAVTGRRQKKTETETTTIAIEQTTEKTQTKKEKNTKETEEDEETTKKEKKTKKETTAEVETTIAEESSETESVQETTTAPAVQAMSGVMYAVSSANVRTGAGTSYDVLGRLSLGTQVSITGKSGEWYQISYGSGQGYVHESLLSESQPQTQPATQVQTQPATQAQTQAPTQAQTQPATQAPSQSSGIDTAAYVDEVIRLVNIERNNAGLPSLTKNTTLCQAAQKRAGELPTLFSHTRPDGTDCFTVLDEYQITAYTSGENIACGQRTPQEVVEEWMNSPGHRQNILNPDFNQIGVGCVQANDIYGIYWTQLFIGE
jgi:uncharacterized protein YkwD/uncharacterized membrane protein